MIYQLVKEIDINFLKKENLLLFFRIASYIILSGLFISMSWQAWGDIIVDFGQELYMAWRIAEGDVLYRDIDYFYLGGPLSVYWDGFWFYVFGSKLSTLVIINLVLLAFLIFLLDFWLTKLSDKFSSYIAVIFFITVFAFGNYTSFNNYNYLAPYSIPLFHGIIILISLLVSLAKWSENRKSIWLILSGILVGLAILNKIEIALTGIAVLVIYLSSRFYLNKKSLTIRNLLTILGASFLPFIFTILLMIQDMPLNEVIFNIFNQWIMFFDGRLAQISELPFYKTVTGTNNLSRNIIGMLGWSVIYLCIILIQTIIALLYSNPRKTIKDTSFFVMLLLSFIVSYFLIPEEYWTDFLKPLPILMAGLVLYSAYNLIKNKDSNYDWPLLFASSVMGFLFIGKILFYSRLHHYGFILAMPGTLLTILFLIHGFNKSLNEFLKNTNFIWISRGFIVGLLMAISLTLIGKSSDAYTFNSFLCCRGVDDKIRTDPIRGEIIQKTIDQINILVRPGQTYTVIPQGTMLNFLTKNKNATPYFHLFSPLYIIHGEDKVIQTFKNTPPDFVIVSPDFSKEFGVFGTDFGVELNKWIANNYDVKWRNNRPGDDKKEKYTVIIAEYKGFKINK